MQFEMTVAWPARLCAVRLSFRGRAHAAPAVAPALMRDFFSITFHRALDVVLNLCRRGQKLCDVRIIRVEILGNFGDLRAQLAREIEQFLLHESHLFTGEWPLQRQ